ncbi:DUF2182 domain-containing protein [Flavimaricola marinus]|uniref:Metal-binding integral membrane protein n=1 Tax=Flavimaricola marinus TaxID=1819565 RepID=A0A238LIS5_9RHOB|nr:DUF2182 domain-containing protein [Flavimaricola marinus]SMY09528.1 hypothetical protein LOM8899_03695 [Flavimaricola marinus]
MLRAALSSSALTAPPRAVIWIGFYGAVGFGWLALFWAVQGQAEPAPGFWASLCIGAGEARLGALWAMWGLMAAAMMLPTFAPALATFLDLGHAGATRIRDAAALTGGYLGVWLGAALAGAVAQQALGSLGLLSEGGSLRGGFAAVLLLGAGLYQLSPAKAACLAKCRMPLTFFMGRWRPGAAHAARMGAELGVVCLGCCWALMALGFVGGTMNLLWMGAATLFMIFEKLPDIGRWLTRPSGWALIVAAGVQALVTAL